MTTRFFDSTDQCNHGPYLPRKVGDVVFRFDDGTGTRDEVIICRGIITSIYEETDVRYGPYWCLIGIKFDDGSERTGFFDYGVVTIDDLKILLSGGLLSPKHQTGCFTEKQDSEIVAKYPIYQELIEREEARPN